MKNSDFENKVRGANSVSGEKLHDFEIILRPSPAPCPAWAWLYINMFESQILLMLLHLHGFWQLTESYIFMHITIWPLWMMSQVEYSSFCQTYVYPYVYTCSIRQKIGMIVQRSYIYRKTPNNWDTIKICCNHPKIWTRRLYLRVMRPKDADGIANSVDRYGNTYIKTIILMCTWLFVLIGAGFHLHVT